MTPYTVRVDRLEMGPDTPARIMGVINLSSESFYSESVAIDREILHQKVKQMESQRVDIIDVGGASTAPQGVYNTQQIPIEEELQRVKAGLEAIMEVASVPISIDTTSAMVAETALDMGAALVNDTSGLQSDLEMAELVSSRDVPVVLMSMCKNPCKSVQQSIEALSMSLDITQTAGIAKDRIIVDPGIGFGKPPEVDFELIRYLQRFTMWGHPVLVGVSRKAFIGDLLYQQNPSDRLAGTIAATSIAVARGARIVRAHDIQEAREAAAIGAKIGGWGRETEQGVDFLGILDERAAEIVIEQIGTGADIRRALSRKAVTLSFFLRNIKTPAALIIKQEMLSLGGDAAYHTDVIDSEVERSDVLVMGTPLQLERFVDKMLRMDYFGLPTVGEKIKVLLDEREERLG